MIGTTLVRTIGSSRRAMAWGTVVAIGVFSLFGVVTGLLPNSLYVRMVPRTPADYLFLVLTAVLAGVYAALRVATTVQDDGSDDSKREDRWAMGGLAGGFLAVGCPICNVFLLALFSSSALMTFFDPLRPILGVLSVGMLAGLIHVRHRRTCSICEP